MNSQLSPPWYTLWNEIKASIGYDRSVTVGELETSSSPYIVPISANEHDKAVAIASITALHHQLGKIAVDVQVKDPDGNIVQPITPGSAEELANLVKKALGNNEWFQEVEVKPLYPGSPGEIVFVVFSKDVIQFWNDDLSDLYGNYNNVVASVFGEVLNPAPGGISIYPSTAKG